MRINKYLASCGIDSRRNVETLVIDGRVKVNGIVEKNLSIEIAETDIVLLDDKPIKCEEKKIYIMLNKPKCYITSVKDEKDKNRRTVLMLTKNIKERIFPIGRLDYNTEGLLLLTNDGDFANNIMHPKKHVSKTYDVLLKIKPTHSQLATLITGTVIEEGITTQPAIIVGPKKISEEYYLVTITIFEGRNRQIRKMFESVNLKVYNLKRIMIGRLGLDNLKSGEYRFLKSNEINDIFM